MIQGPSCNGVNVIEIEQCIMTNMSLLFIIELLIDYYYYDDMVFVGVA